MKYLSLFSGIGGFELGIQQAYESYNEHAPIGEEPKQEERPQGREWPTDFDGVQLHTGDGTTPLCVGYSEVDKYAVQIYQKHFPEHKNYGDITKIITSELPDFDLLVGGFPCQAFSIAGKRKGFEDTRGTLFFEIARILRAKQPRLLLLENVKGLLSHDNGRTFSTIISTLDELGYDLQWQVLNSKNHGVPQNRERVFIIGHLRGTSRPQIFPIFGTDSKDIIVNGVLDTETWRKRHEQIRRTHDVDGISPTLPTGTGGGVMTKIAFAERGRYREDGKVEQQIETRQDGLTNTLTRVEKDNRVLDGMQVRRLTPTECERLQGFPGVEKSSIINVCKNANGVEIYLSTKKPNNVAQSDVLINCVENGVEIRNQEKLLLYAKDAEKKNWSHPLIKIEDFVRLLVGINTIGEREIKRGEAELHPKGLCLTAQKSGEKQESGFGNEIMQPVGIAENDSITLKQLLKFTTLDHLGTESSAQKLPTLSFFVIRAITGFIPKETLNQDTFTIEVRTKMGWTEGLSDTQRYKTLGNAVTVNVIREIMRKMNVT